VETNICKGSSSLILQNGLNTSQTLFYQIDLSANMAVLTINNNVVATHNKHIPGPYDVMSVVAGIKNQATVTATTLALDTIFFQNLDQLQITNSALFNLLQISSVLLYGKPLFAVYDDANSFAEITYNTGLNIFQFSIGKVFYKTNLITVPSQSITVASIDDSAGVKYFKFYLDYNDFNLSSTVFSATVESVDTNSIIVDQLPAITYLNNFKQINLNGYFIGLGRTTAVMLLSTIAIWGLRIPLAKFLPLWFGLNGIWIGISASFVIGFLLYEIFHFVLLLKWI
jgi:Na+-translocating ferredoxin:NAD+ oxidoreductase RnfE subunit